MAEAEETCGHPDAWFWVYQDDHWMDGRYLCFQCVQERVQELPRLGELVIGRYGEE